MLWALFLNIAAGIVGLFLADRFVTGVGFLGPVFPENWKDMNTIMGSLLFVGAFLGVLNFFIKPLLKKITLPLRIITFNLFNLVIAMALIWATDVLFRELDIKGILPLFLTTLIVLVLGFVLIKWMSPQNKAFGK